MPTARHMEDVEQKSTAERHQPQLLGELGPQIEALFMFTPSLSTSSSSSQTPTTPPEDSS